MAKATHKKITLSRQVETAGIILRVGDTHVVTVAFLAKIVADHGKDVIASEEALSKG